jgi:hypothetical protein
LQQPGREHTHRSKGGRQGAQICDAATKTGISLHKSKEGEGKIDTEGGGDRSKRERHISAIEGGILASTNRDSPSNRSYREDREETSQISATIGREEDESREIHLELKRRKWQRAGGGVGGVL